MQGYPRDALSITAQTGSRGVTVVVPDSEPALIGPVPGSTAPSVVWTAVTATPCSTPWAAFTAAGSLMRGRPGSAEAAPRSESGPSFPYDHCSAWDPAAGWGASSTITVA